MDNENKKKSSSFKIIGAVLGCVAMAVLYISGGIYAVERLKQTAFYQETIAKAKLLQEQEAKPEKAKVDSGTAENSDTDSPALFSGLEKPAKPQQDDDIVSAFAEQEQEEQLEQQKPEQALPYSQPSADGNIHVANAQLIPSADYANVVVSDVSEVVKAVMPCVVAITNEYTAYDYWYDEMIDEEANGSGIIVGQTDEELLIVTNYHVIEDSKELYVQFVDDKEVAAYVKGTAPKDDLAVVTVFKQDISSPTLSSIAIAVLGDSDALQVGEPAIAIGNSLGFGQSVTTGVISALNREAFPDDPDIRQDYLIQTDAAINPGNSGGALLNIRGEVIGINSSKIADYVIEGMGYAIPIATAKPIIDELAQMETKRKASAEQRAFLGVSGDDVSREAIEKYDMPAGIYVSRVIKGSAAELAGIAKGDIITAVGGEKVTKMTELQGILEYYTAGMEIEITLMRQQEGGYKEKIVSVVLGHKED